MPPDTKMKQTDAPKQPVVRYRDETPPQACPYGRVQRVVTGGEGGVANVHVVTVTAGGTHVHAEYDEVYYVVSGSGELYLDEEVYALRPGAVVVIPAGVPHALKADDGTRLEFVIFGTPPVPITDPQACPRKPERP